MKINTFLKMSGLIQCLCKQNDYAVPKLKPILRQNYALVYSNVSSQSRGIFD